METKQKFIKVGVKIVDQYAIEWVDEIEFLTNDKCFFIINTKSKNQIKIIEPTYGSGNKIREKLLKDIGFK